MWSEETIKINDRLKTMAGKIKPGQTCADIGTDHGYLPLYLYEKGICPRVILTDISEASLEKAMAAAGAAQYGNDVSFRVGDGLKVIEKGEVDCVVIAGMGGKLIRDILAEDPEKTESFSRFILQPRTASGPLRKWLLEAGFLFLSEDIVKEGDFLPEIITVAPGNNTETDPGDFDYFDNVEGVDLAAGIRNSLTGKGDEYPDEDSIHFSVPMWMLNGKGPVLEFLRNRLAIQEGILDGLARAKTPDEEAVERTKYNIDYLKQIIEIKELREKYERNAKG